MSGVRMFWYGDAEVIRAHSIHSPRPTAVKLQRLMWCPFRPPPRTVVCAHYDHLTTAVGMKE